MMWGQARAFDLLLLLLLFFFFFFFVPNPALRLMLVVMAVVMVTSVEEEDGDKVVKEEAAFHVDARPSDSCKTTCGECRTTILLVKPPLPQTDPQDCICQKTLLQPLRWTFSICFLAQSNLSTLLSSQTCTGPH